MKKSNYIFPLVIGELIAIIFLALSKTLELPEVITNLAKYFPIILPILSLFGVVIAYAIGKKIPAIFQLAKFVLVGALNTFIDLGILNILMFVFSINAGLLYSVFKGISFFCSVVNSYFWNKFWTYEKSDNVALKEFGKFVLVAGTGFFLNVAIASIIVNFIHPLFNISPKLWANIGAITATICVFLWNFLGYKLIVFKK